jgi:hypothetical protein
MQVHVYVFISRETRLPRAAPEIRPERQNVQHVKYVQHVKL